MATPSPTMATTSGRTWRKHARTALLLGAVGAVVAPALIPVSTAGLEPHPAPALSYADALVKFQQLAEQDGSEVNPMCRSQLLVHSHPTEWAIVLLHGITNCPYQFETFAPLLYQRGYNVLIPRMPFNGYLDTETDALRHLTAEHLRDYGDRSVDIARGLGHKVAVLGLSTGGVVAAWLAQFRADVDRAVIVAPALGLGVVPAPLSNMAMHAFVRLPDLRKRRKAGSIEPPQVYAYQSSRSAGQWLRLATRVFQAARHTAPLARSAVIVSNGYDHVVSNRRTAHLIQLWQGTGYPVEQYLFPPDLHLKHDCIDPRQPDQHTEIVYPVLLDLLVPPATSA